MKKSFWVPFIVLFSLALPYLVTDRYYMHILIICGIYIIVASGLNLVVGYMGYISFAHNALYGIGSYASALLMLRANFPFEIAMVTAALIAGLGGFIIGFLPLRLKLQGPYFALVTMAFGLVVVAVIHNSIGLTGGPAGLTSIPSASFLGIELKTRREFYFLVIAMAWLTLLLIYKLANSKVGRAFEAIREDEEMADSIGVNITFFKVVCFTLSAALTGVAGSLYAHYTRFLGPDMFSIGEAVDMIMMVIIGGMGTIIGPVVGAILIVILPEALRALEEYRMIFYSLLLIFTIMFIPKGLVGFADAVFGKMRKNS